MLAVYSLPSVIDYSYYAVREHAIRVRSDCRCAVVGPQGPVGATGRPGIRGPDGRRGLTGASGLPGPAGNSNKHYSFAHLCLL